MDLKDISQIVNRIRRMPTLSPVATHLLMLSADDANDLRELVQVIHSDAFLTMRVLKVANMAAHSVGRSVTSLSRAVIALGSNMVVGIAMQACAPGVFNTALSAYSSTEGKLWEHSLFTGLAAKAIAKQMAGGASPELAFTAGLLHDLGKVVISQLLNQPGRPSIRLAALKRQALMECECKSAGMDHATLGYWLACHWSLPPELCLPIRYHHSPDEAPEEMVRLCSAVHYGDLLAHKAGYTTEENEDRSAGHAYLEGGKLGKILIEVDHEFKQIREAVLGPAMEEQPEDLRHSATP